MCKRERRLFFYVRLRFNFLLLVIGEDKDYFFLVGSIGLGGVWVGLILIVYFFRRWVKGGFLVLGVRGLMLEVVADVFFLIVSVFCEVSNVVGSVNRSIALDV